MRLLFCLKKNEVMMVLFEVAAVVSPCRIMQDFWRVKRWFLEMLLDRKRHFVNFRGLSRAFRGIFVEFLTIEK